MTTVEPTREVVEAPERRGPAGSSARGQPDVRAQPEGPREPSGPDRPARRRRPAPRAHPFWRFGYPALVLAAGLTVVLLGLQGGRTVFRSTVGQVEEAVILQPDEPGYLVLVGATPTLLALHTDDGQLVGVTFMARTGLDSGGGMVLLPADLLVDPPGSPDEQSEFLSEAYVAGGAAAVERHAEEIFGLGFDEVVEVTGEELAGHMALVEPLPSLLPDDLTETGPDGTVRVLYPAGRNQLSGTDAAAVYGLRNAGEAEANRLERQRALWESWLGQIGRADNIDDAVLPFDSGLWPYLEALGAGTSVVNVAPLRSVALDAGERPFYLLEEEQQAWLRSRAAELVPWPTGPQSFLRPTVQLLDGTGDPERRDSLADSIIAAGGIVTVIGNAPEFGVLDTLVAYHRPELIDAANTIALELGSGMALIELDEGPPALSDITVTVGLSQASR